MKGCRVSGVLCIPGISGKYNGLHYIMHNTDSLLFPDPIRLLSLSTVVLNSRDW